MVRRVSIGVGAIVGLLVLTLASLALFFDVNRYKPQIETAVAKSTGMTLKIGGKASLKIFPQIRIALRDVRLSNKGSELFKGESVEVVPQLSPFIRRRELIINSVVLKHPVINLENVEKFRSQQKAQEGQASASAGEVHSVTIDNGELTHLAKGVNATFSRIGWGAGGVSLRGKVKVQSLQVGQLAVSNVKADISDDRGLVNLTQTDASLFGGTVQGTAQLDLRGAIPKFKINQKASHIDLAQVPSSVRGRVSGTAEGSVNIAGSGKSSAAALKTIVGDVSVRSRKVTITGVDVDELAGQLKTAQGLDIVRLGPGLLAPALGQAAGTAGGAPEKKSEIRDLASDWKIGGGVAQTKDVAFSTSKTTIAFKGGINLITKEYQNFFVAAVDPKGCSKTKVEVSGSLSNPRPTAGSVGEQISRSYLGKAGGAAGGALSGLLGGDKGNSKDAGGCDHFYSGTALAS